ncbi:Uncharacterized protein PECH_004982 [Penicillium ucsense]|uniref:WD repeat protein n=1 Tax=Penicillium ucsense TaxID=2839758 RepID=A0A8J8WGG0_9EURO|nr:Uncharacterized protein PECM_008869 [Penicillium ucsense]KAF7736767.1 Uncharacterized protein PECH_004982 [Penicillium ucsense]
MATTAPLSTKSKLVGPGSSLRITPSNSPVLRPGARSPSKPAHVSVLSLQTVLGTTSSTPNGFSSHEPSRRFALCAGSAAVLAEVDNDGNVSQRFFRARPSASGVNPTTSFYNQSAPPATPDPRSRSLAHIRSNPHLTLTNGSPSNDVSDNGSPRAWSSRERVKAVTCVSISPNGRFLAVGETGYNPRVLIFSTALDSSPDVPLSIINEHTFGVCSLAFSPDSQYLATLGNPNDGFLFIWSINLKTGLAKLHSTNKCTSIVREIRWVGQALVTVGVRHVKVWRLPVVRPASPTKTRLALEGVPSSNPVPKALSGRNCILGQMNDHTFACISSISEREAVLGTESGAVCLLDDREGCQRLTVAKQVEFAITSVAVDIDRESIWLGGREKRVQRLTFEEIRSSALNSSSLTFRTERSAMIKNMKPPALVCMGLISSYLVTVEATREIQVYPIGSIPENGELDRGTTRVSAHQDPVLGIRALRTSNILGAEIFSWSRNGSVNFWDFSGKCLLTRTVTVGESVAGDEDVQNELKVLRAADDADWFVAGDRYGVVRLYLGKTWECLEETRAHGAEITDVAVQKVDNCWLVATAGRDRMVQLFLKSESHLQLKQTMDEHVGAVGQVLFLNDGQKLLSSSADRTIVIRERATREDEGMTCFAYLITKVITLKASPVSMALSPDDSNTLYVSSMDRCIFRFDIPSGRQVHSFRASDSEANDAVVISSMTILDEIPDKSPKLLIGVSSTDKSIRVYDLEKDCLLTGEFGHTEGVTDVLLYEQPSHSENGRPGRRNLITTGLDGLLMIWDLSVQPYLPIEYGPGTRDDEGPVKESAAARPPLRKVLSRSELAGFQRPDNPSPLGTPTPSRAYSPTLSRKTSRLSLNPPSAQRTSHHETPSPPNTRTSISLSPNENLRRSPSPISPRAKPHTPTPAQSKTVRSTNRRSSTDFRSRVKTSSRGEFGSLDMSTDQLCRALRAYRKKLHCSRKQPHAQNELERELLTTLRAVGTRYQSSDESGETETDSSGKEVERQPANQSVSSRPHQPRHMPSTPLLRQREVRPVSRSHSYDAS